MSAALHVGPDRRGAAYWGIAWGVGVGIVEYLTVAPIDEWGSLRQLFFFLLYWLMPFWCAVGILFVWLADHQERMASLGWLLAVLLALSGLSAVACPLLSIVLIGVTRDAFPQFQPYAAQLQWIAPTWTNWGTLALYHLWDATFYGSLLVAARLFTRRVERSRRLLYESAMARSRAEALLDAARLQALQAQIDPNLLLDSMQELEQRYRASPERAEQLLEALVEFLRYAMHGLRVPVSTLDAELHLARAFSHLQVERGVVGAWRIVDDPTPPSSRPLKFPSLLMLRLLALGGEGGRPLLRVRVEGERAVLSFHGFVGRISTELCQQIRTRLFTLYGRHFDVDSDAFTLSQLRITLPLFPVPSGEIHA